MKNLRMFEIKFMGPTNHKGSRLKITDHRHKKSVILSKSYEFNSIMDQAKEYLESKGITIVGQSEGIKNDMLLSDNFDKQIKG